MGETLNQRWAAHLVGALVAGGVRHAVIAPGSRSTPLALALADRPDVVCWPVIDERSAGFVALGLAKGSGAPAAVVCTSGTAAANLLPAAVEASEGATPLILLTADRPWELHGRGAPQTIVQSGIFGRFTRLAEDLPAPFEAGLAHLVAVAARAAACASELRGPVHLNVPFAEPLAPSDPGPGPVVDPRLAVTRAPDRPDVSPLHEALRGAERVLIVCGPRELDDGFGGAVERLAARLAAPVIAEAASNARFGHRTIAAWDAVLHDERRARELRPDVVLRFGGGLTLKSLTGWLERWGARELHVCDDARLFDPEHRAEVVVRGDATVACERLAAEAAEGRGAAYLRAWEEAQARVLRRAPTAAGALTEPAVAREAVAALPEGGALVVSSSMPIRDVETFGLTARRGVRVYSNRGVNGIDGVMSTALGVAAARRRPTLLLLGDVAAIHDLNAWITAKQLGLSLAVLLVNNDGGGIFNFLPVAGRTPHFERLFGTPHGVDFSHLAGLAGASLHRPTDVESLRRALATALEGGLHLVEARVDRARNVEQRRAALAELGEER